MSSKVVSFQEVFGTNTIGSSGELVFASMLGTALKEHGYRLSLEGCFVDMDKCNQQSRVFFDKVVGEGYIATQYTPGRVPIYTDFDIEYPFSIFSAQEMFSPTGKEGVLTFDRDTAYNKVYAKLREIRPFRTENLRLTLQYLVVNHIARVIQGTADFVLHLDLTSDRMGNSYFYSPIVFWLEAYPNLKDYVQLTVAETREFDYSNFIYSAYNYNTRRMYTAVEKREVIDKLGIKPGAILVLWDRKLKPQSIDGSITQRVLVRYDGLTEDKSALRFTSIPEPYTLEERRVQFNSVPAEYRSYYLDMLKPPQRGSYVGVTYHLRDMGIEGYLYDENHFITKLDPNEETTKLVSFNGSSAVEEVSMSAVNAIYWVLAQWGFDFNKQLFKDMYLGGEEPLVELVAHQPQGTAEDK